MAVHRQFFKTQLVKTLRDSLRLVSQTDVILGRNNQLWDHTGTNLPPHNCPLEQHRGCV